MTNRETGKISWFNTAKGYGFIEREDSQAVFVHYRSIRSEGYRKLSDGQDEEYTLVAKIAGLQAEDVVTIFKPA